jgi:ElaA protein
MQIWLCKEFNDLSTEELYSILQLRTEIFVVEQNCVFQDMDGKDEDAYHLMCYEDDRLIAYTRLLPEGISYRECSIGRVVTKKINRGTGIGKELMAISIEYCYRLFGKSPIRIGAQLYLEKFYSSFGFKKESDIYIEDGIPHIEMVLSPA